MTALLLALAIWQGPPTDITASTDRSRLQVGEQLTLTIRVRTRVAQLLGVDVPPPNGFSIVGANEVTDVALSGPTVIRTLTRQLVLRAERPGTYLIGPIRVRQSGVHVQTDAIAVTIDSASTLPTGELSPLARAMLEAAPPPARTDRVSLVVLVPHDTIIAGDQLDVVVAAWFPHDVMAKLRRPPVLTLPGARGAWAYPQNAPSGVVLSRRAHGVSFDLFALHQVLFPLAPGQVVIPAASAEYALPVSFSFFSREERYDLGSDSVIVTVVAPPVAGARGAAGSDAGVVARDLTVDLELSSAAGRVGDPLEARITLAGRGNVDLWPAPTVRWPAPLRAYPGETAVSLTEEGGRIGGAKVFRTLLVPDSAGSFVIPEIRYPYFDPGTRSYRVAGLAPRALAVAAGAEPRAARTVPPLLETEGAPLVDRLGAPLVPWGWIVLALLPPSLFLLGRVVRRRRPSRRPADAAAPRIHEGLARIELEFHRVLSSHVPDAEARDGDQLARALRASGLESAVADHVMRLRDRLRATRYGPHGVGDVAELSAEIDQVLKVLGAEPPASRHRRATLVALLLAVGGGAVAPAPRLGAQQARPEALYEAGALHTAADSFAARAAAGSLVAAHWYNLGATLYRAGDDGKAVAAWTLAARLAPRNRTIRQARRLLPAPDAASEALLLVGPATPMEWWLAGALLWIACWATAWRRGGSRVVLVVALGIAAASAGVAGFKEWQRRHAPVGVVIAPATPVRAAPYGAAGASATLDPGAALLIEDSYAGGRWLRVSRADGIAGWVLASQVVRL